MHFIHIGKTGGSAIKHALRPFYKAGAEMALGPIVLHRGHEFRLKDVPRGDLAIFCVRDPLSLFVSAFYSRLRKGQPKDYFEWSPGEAAAFARFSTPQALAGALVSRMTRSAQAAKQAMRSIQHMRALRRRFLQPREVRAHRRQIAYIGRQETLDDDWHRIRALLGLPAEADLPPDRRSRTAAPVRRPALDRGRRGAPPARTTGGSPRSSRVCERMRVANGWTGEPPRRGSPSRSRSAAAAVGAAPVPDATLRTLRELLAVAIAVSVVHYADNVAKFADYPEPESGPAPSRTSSPSPGSRSRRPRSRATRC